MSQSTHNWHRILSSRLAYKYFTVCPGLYSNVHFSFQSSSVQHSVELKDRWSSFSAVLIRGGDTLHLQFDTDVHHTTCNIWSTHVDDRSEAGNGSEPAVNAHRSAITSGWSFRSSCHAASSPASDKCFPLYFRCSKFVRKWLSVTASLKCFITVIKCGFSASALRRLRHTSQSSAIVGLSDCNLEMHLILAVAEHENFWLHSMDQHSWSASRSGHLFI